MGLVELKAALNNQEDIENLLVEYRSIRGILTSFGLRPHPHYYDIIREAAYKNKVTIKSSNNKNTRGIILKNKSKKISENGIPLKRGLFSNDDKVREAVAGAKSYQEAIARLGVKNCGTNYRRLTLACSRIGIQAPKLHYQDNRKKSVKKSFVRYRYNLDDKKLIAAAQQGKTVKMALAEQGISNPSSQLRVRASSIVKENGNEFSRARNATGNYRTPKKDINLFLVRGTSPISAGIKKRLIEEGILSNKCAICKIPPFWRNKPIVLQLDHINGEPTDNRLSNLRLLCPNCHSQTDTFMNRQRSPIS